MVKIIGMIIAACIVATVVLIYAYKQNMFSIRSLFKSKKATQNSYLTNLLKLTSELGGFANIKKINYVKHKLVVDLVNNKGIVHNHKISGSSILIDENSFANLEEGYKLLKYAIKK